MQHMQKIIDEYDDISLLKATAQPLKSGMGTICSLLELSTDALEEVREDLRATSGKERELMCTKLDVQIAKYKSVLDRHQNENTDVTTNDKVQL